MIIRDIPPAAIYRIREEMYHRLGRRRYYALLLDVALNRYTDAQTIYLPNQIPQWRQKFLIEEERIQLRKESWRRRHRNRDCKGGAI